MAVVRPGSGGSTAAGMAKGTFACCILLSLTPKDVHLSLTLG